jgi:hypothetical protein
MGVPSSIMLAKPFAPAQLVTAVAQLLNGGPFADHLEVKGLPVRYVLRPRRLPEGL